MEEWKRSGEGWKNLKCVSSIDWLIDWDIYFKSIVSKGLGLRLVLVLVLVLVLPLLAHV